MWATGWQGFTAGHPDDLPKTKEQTMDDPRITAVRANKKVGRGSCSSIDECMTDEELLAALNENGVKTPATAVKWALRHERLYLEQGLNQRWGEDDDPQLLNYREFIRDDKDTEEE
jgi:hypothetical protein